MLSGVGWGQIEQKISDRPGGCFLRHWRTGKCRFIRCTCRRGETCEEKGGNTCRKSIDQINLQKTGRHSPKLLCNARRGRTGCWIHVRHVEENARNDGARFRDVALVVIVCLLL